MNPEILLSSPAPADSVPRSCQAHLTRRNPELAVEQLKPFEQLCEPDERQRGFAIKDRAGRYRSATHLDLYLEASDIEISENVPEPVRSQLEIAKTLLAYSWYFYPFNVTACLQAFL